MRDSVGKVLAINQNGRSELNSLFGYSMGKHNMKQI